jgi:alpha-D-ribose 1-methylphosphonate 5-triphosphate synthase subunit PhnL
MLVVENLSKRFRLHMQGGIDVQALEGVSFEVHRGEFVGLSGPSGAGKSTALKCVHRTYLPTSGTIRFLSSNRGEVDLATLPEREILELRRSEIGFVSQFLRVIPRVATIDLVAEPLRTRMAISHDEARRQAADLLDRLRIPRNLFSAYPATFSGGEQQRVNIARAVGWRPSLLLLDEPTASLDRASAEIALGLLSELRDEGCTIVGIFHDPELLSRIADRTIRIGANQ